MDKIGEKLGNYTKANVYTYCFAALQNVNKDWSVVGHIMDIIYQEPCFKIP